MERNHSIELWRFWISIQIVLYHFVGEMLVTARDVEWLVNRTSRVCVEFFFILTGFLLMRRFRRDPRESAMRMVGHKLKGVYPYYFLSLTLLLAARSIANGTNFLKNTLNNIGDFFLLQNLLRAKNYAVVNTHLWFIPAMIFACAIIWLLLQRSEKAMTTCLIPIGAAVVYASIIVRLGNIANAASGFLHIGGDKGLLIDLMSLRALAGVGIGVLCYRAYEWLKPLRFSKPLRRAMLAVEWVGFIGLAAFAFRRATKSAGLLVVVGFALLVILSFINAAQYPKPLCKLFAYLGRLSLPVYVFHRFVQEFVLPRVFDVSVWSWWTFAGYMGLVILFAMLMDAVTRLMIKLLTALFRRLRRQIDPPAASAPASPPIDS